MADILTQISEFAPALMDHEQFDPAAHDPAELLRMAKGGNHEVAWLYLAQSAVPTARTLIRRYQRATGQYSDRDELAQVAMAGIAEAIEAAPLDLRKPFAVFAYPHMVASLYQFLTIAAAPITIPTSILKRYHAAWEHATSVEEARENAASGWYGDAAMSRETFDRVYAITAIEGITTPDEVEVFEQTHPDATPPACEEDPRPPTMPSREAIEADARSNARDYVLMVLEQAPSGDREILELAYGIGTTPMSTADIAARLHVTPRRIQQLRKAAEGRLREQHEGKMVHGREIPKTRRSSDSGPDCARSGCARG